MTAPENLARRYHLKNIRILLAEGFTDEELRQLCFDHPAFQAFYPHLPQPASRAELARRILDYANHKALLDTLLVWAKEQNPNRYVQYQPYEAPLTDSPAKFDIYTTPDTKPSQSDPTRVLAHRVVLSKKYNLWADESTKEYYIREESKILPLHVSPYDNDIGQQREDLLQTMRTHERLLVLGEPGMGKTIALQRMMWETTQAGEPVIPIFVQLLYFQGNLIEDIRMALSETGELRFNKLKDVSAFLQNTRCLIMFDGLNEVPGEQREQAVVEIAHFVRQFNKHHRFIVTSRSQDPLWKKLRAGSVIEKAVVIQHITNDQARNYLIVHLGDRKGRDLHDRLNECLKGLSRTPLLLWMIKEAGLEGKELPGNRGELFDHFVDKMLAIDGEKLKLDLPWWVKKRALSHLAFTLQQEHQLACAPERAEDIVVKSEPNFNAETILKEALVHGLLQGERQVRFLHQSVQEYFVGKALCNEVQEECQVPSLKRWVQSQLGRRSRLVTWAQDDWWAESFVQLAGLTETPSWLVSEIAPVNPWLAFWCSIEGNPVDEKARSIVEAKTVALLRSKDTNQRLQAVNELGRVENPRTIEYLVEALGDRDGNVLNSSIQSLTKLGEPAVDPLIIALRDSNAAVRSGVAQVLGKLGDTRAIEPLIVTLGDNDEKVRSIVVNMLIGLGKPAVEPLIITLKTRKTPTIRVGAVKALGKLGDGRAVEHFIAILNNSNTPPDLLKEVIIALGELRDKQAAKPLVAILRNNSRSAIWLETAEALGKLGDIQAPESLVNALKSPDWSLQERAAKALGFLGDKRAVSKLIPALKYPNKSVQEAVVEALTRLDTQAAQDAVSKWNQAEAKQQ